VLLEITQASAMGCTSGIHLPVTTLKGQFEDIYEVGQTLGAGSFGCVFAVTRRDTGRKEQRAVKVMRLADNLGKVKEKCISDNLNQLKCETNIWHSASRHPGCVKLLEMFVGRKHIYAVMERCGPSLMECVAELSAWSDGKFMKLVRGMLQPLAYLHQRRIVHRDIKPDNYLFASSSNRDIVKLCDFGMAAHVPKDPGFLVGRYGTAPYMSPEMAKATGHSLGTDIWSLAATLYVILFGEFLYMPAEPHNPKAMRACIIHDYPRPKFQRRKDMVGEVVIREAATLTAKLLERCPRARCTATEALKMIPASSEEPCKEMT